MLKFLVRKKQKGALSMLPKLIEPSLLKIIAKEVQDRRLIYEVAGKYYPKGAENLAREIAKKLGLKYQDSLETQVVRKNINQLPVQDLKLAGAFPIVNGGSIIGLACVDPDLLLRKFPIPKHFLIKISTWSCIIKAWQSVESSTALAVYTEKQVEHLLPALLENITSIAITNQQNSFKIIIEESISKYRIYNNSAECIEGRIDPGLAIACKKYLREHPSWCRLALSVPSKAMYNASIKFHKKGFLVELQCFAKSSQVNKKNLQEVETFEQNTRSKIMIVDDNSVFTKVLKRHFNQYDYQLLPFSSAEAAFQNLVKQKTKPDVIISDLHMPKFNGNDFLKKIRTMENLQDIPIVILTSDTDIQSKLEVIGSGADAYISKSEDPRLIGVQVQALISRQSRKEKCLQA